MAIAVDGLLYLLPQDVVCLAFFLMVVDVLNPLFCHHTQSALVHVIAEALCALPLLKTSSLPQLLHTGCVERTSVNLDNLQAVFVILPLHLQMHVAIIMELPQDLCLFLISAK